MTYFHTTVLSKSNHSLMLLHFTLRSYLIEDNYYILFIKTDLLCIFYMVLNIHSPILCI